MSNIQPTLDPGRGNNGWKVDIWKPTAAPLVWYFRNGFSRSFLELLNAWQPCVPMSNNAKCQWMAFLFRTCFKIGGKWQRASWKLIVINFCNGWDTNLHILNIFATIFIFFDKARAHSTYLPSDEQTLAGNGWGSRESEEYNQIPELEQLMMFAISSVLA